MTLESNAASPGVVDGALTGTAGTGKLNFMRCMTFAFVLGVTSAGALSAQGIPGRDLLEFPIGALAEAPALAIASGDGFRNPASVMLVPGARGRISVGSLITGSEQGVTAQLLGVAVAVPRATTVGLSVVRASVDGIVRTEEDPQASGGDVPYNTIVLSATGARRSRGNTTIGLAVRYRSGLLDASRQNALGLDGGVIVDSLVGRDVRVGLSSFLWRPGTGDGDETAVAAAVDGHVFGSDSTASGRVGYSYTYSDRLLREHFVFASGRLGVWEGRGGIARASAFGDQATRVRLGIGLHYARYTVGVAREDNSSGLSPTYQFTLTAVLP